MMIDLRDDYDERTEVQGGDLFRKGATVQVWWLRDGLGQALDAPIPETWTLPETPHGVAQAQENFESMRERWA